MSTKLKVGTPCKFYKADGTYGYFSVQKNIYDDGGTNARHRLVIVVPGGLFPEGSDIAPLIRKIANKKLKQRVKVLTSGEVPTNERLKLHTMAAALTAWKAENAAAWGADGFDELELEDFQEEVDDFEDSDEEEEGEAEEEGDHVPGGADPAPGVPLAGAGGDIADVLANLAKLLGKDDKPVLTKFNKDMEWDTWYALYQVWRTDMRKAGHTIGVSDVLGACSDTTKKSLVKKLGTAGMTVDKVIEEMRFKARGDPKKWLFKVMKDWFLHTNDDKDSLDDHFGNISKHQRDVHKVLGVKLPDIMWGWFTLFSMDLDEETLSHVLTMCNGDYSPKTVQAALTNQLNSGEHMGGKKKSAKFTENTHAATDPATERKKTEKEENKDTTLLSKLEELINVVKSSSNKGKGKGKQGKGSGGNPWKPPCKFGDKCNNILNCKHYHPPRVVEQARRDKGENPV